MNFNIACEKLTGNPTAQAWVAAHDFTPINPKLVSEKGRLLTIISMAASREAELPKNENLIVEKEILTRLQEQYFGKEGNPLKLLEEAVEKIRKDFNTPNESLSILCAVLLGDKILLANFGKNEAWIKRNGKLGKILSASEKTNAIAGPILNRDVFLLGTSTFFSKVTPEFLKSDNSFLASIENPEGDLGVLSLKAESQNVVVPAIQKEKEIMPTVQKVSQISPIRIFAAKMIDRILSILPQKKIFVKEDLVAVKMMKRRKATTIAGAILLGLLIISIIFGIRQQKISSFQATYIGTLNSAQHSLDEAKSLASVDPARARSLVLDANNQISALVSKNLKDDRITKLAADIANAMGQIAGLYNENPSLYLDLSLISSGFKGDDMSSSDERMVVLDRSGKRLVSIDVPTSKTAVVAGPDIMPNAKYVAAYSDRNFVTADNGVWEIGNEASILIKPDWGKNILAYAYTGNFYILDKDNGSLWRYQGDGGAFTASKENWFGTGVKPDLGNVISWTIDGNIWMLTSDGQILRFSGGSPIDFSLKDLDKNLNAVDLFTTQDSKYLYILDSGNGRVLVISKDDGSFVAQYVADNIKSAKKIIVSETDKKIILLEGDKLYSLDIKHLN